eukprot:4725893-Prymnesium_polylepis.2
MAPCERIAMLSASASASSMKCVVTAPIARGHKRTPVAQAKRRCNKRAVRGGGAVAGRVERSCARRDTHAARCAPPWPAARPPRWCGASVGPSQPSARRAAQSSDCRSSRPPRRACASGRLRGGPPRTRRARRGRRAG